MQFLAGPSARLQREERCWSCPRLARTFRSSVAAGILPEMSAPTEMCPVHRHIVPITHLCLLLCSCICSRGSKKRLLGNESKWLFLLVSIHFSSRSTKRRDTRKQKKSLLCPHPAERGPSLHKGKFWCLNAAIRRNCM